MWKPSGSQMFGGVVAGMVLVGFTLTAISAVPSSQSEYALPGVAGGARAAAPSMVPLWFDSVANFPRPTGDSYPMPVAVTSVPPVPRDVTVTNFPASQPVTIAPNRGTATEAMVTVGTTPVVVIPAGANRSYMFTQNQSTTAVLTCSLNGSTPVSGTTGSEVYPMSNIVASGFASGFMPVGPVTCVAPTAGVRVHVRYVQ